MESERDQNIKQLWEILHPQGEFKYNYFISCISVAKELKKLCEPKFLPLLMIIYRVVVKEKVPENVSHIYLCEKLITYVDSLCMKSAEYVTYRKLGIVPHPGNIGIETCKSLSSRLKPLQMQSVADMFPVSFSFYNISLPDSYLPLKAGYEGYQPFLIKGVFFERVLNKDFQFYINYYAQNSKTDNQFKESISFNLNDVEEVDYYARNFLEQFLSDREKGKVSDKWFTDAHIKLIIYLHEGFKIGEIPLNIKWEKLCETDYVKKFAL